MTAPRRLRRTTSCTSRAATRSRSPISTPSALNTLHLMAGDTISIAYNDELDALGRTNQKTTDTSTVRTGHTGTFVIAEPSILAGDALHLSVSDLDLSSLAAGSPTTLSMT